MIRSLSFIKLITVEPILFLYYIGYYSTLNVCENFRLERYCRVSLDRGEDCDSLGDGTDSDLEEDVQNLENQFMVYESYISSILTVLLLAFIASWSDKHGRLVPLVLGLGGWILYSIVYLLADLNPSWSAWILLLAAFLRSMGGWHWVILMASYAHIADISTQDDRTTRMNILMAVKCFGMAVGTAVGPLLYDSIGYSGVFIVTIILFASCIIWAYLIIPHIPYSPQDSSQVKSLGKRIVSIPRKMKQSMAELIETAVRKRDGHGRFLLNYYIFLMLIMILSFPKKMFLWARLVLQWDINSYSVYAVTDQFVCTIVMFLFTPLIKYLNWHDCIIGAITQLTLFCKTLAFGLLTNPSQWYVVYIFSVVPQWIPSICIRSLISKQCGSNEVGRAFSLLAICECIWPIVENSLYGAVYAATLYTYPSAIHLVESINGVVVFASFLGIHLLVDWQDIKPIPEDPVDSTRRDRGASHTEM